MITYMILAVPWDGLWTLSFGLSQFLGHGSWLVALNPICGVTVASDDEHYLPYSAVFNTGECVCNSDAGNKLRRIAETNLSWLDEWMTATLKW